MSDPSISVKLTCDAWETLVDRRLTRLQWFIKEQAEEGIDPYHQEGNACEPFATFKEAREHLATNPEFPQVSGTCIDEINEYNTIDKLRQQIKDQFQEACQRQGWTPKI